MSAMSKLSYNYNLYNYKGINKDLKSHEIFIKSGIVVTTLETYLIPNKLISHEISKIQLFCRF